MESVSFHDKSTMHDRAVTVKARKEPSDIGKDYRKWILVPP